LLQYTNKFGEIGIADLYQNPSQRPRKGMTHVPALTRGCKRLFMPSKERYANGMELLLLQGIPVTRESSLKMNTLQIMASQTTHSSQCSLAGNAMHSSCVGMMCVPLLFISSTHE